MSIKRVSHFFVASICALVAANSSVYGQINLPETQAAQRFSQLFDCLNQLDGKERETFIDDAFSKDFEYSADARSNAIDEIHAEYGPTELVDVFESTDFKIACLLKSIRGKQYLKIELEVENSDPHKISGIDFSLTQVSSPGKYFDVEKLPPGQTGQRIQTAIAAINSNDDAKIIEFIESNTSADLRKHQAKAKQVIAFKNMHDLTGGVQFYAIRNYKSKTPADRHVVILKKNLGGWHALVMTIDPTTPHEITSN